MALPRSTLQNPSTRGYEHSHPHPAAKLPPEHAIGEVLLQLQILSAQVNTSKRFPMSIEDLGADAVALEAGDFEFMGSGMPLADFDQTSWLYDMESGDFGKDELDQIFAQHYARLFHQRPRYQYAGEHKIPYGGALEEARGRLRQIINSRQSPVQQSACSTHGLAKASGLGTMTVERCFSPVRKFGQVAATMRGYQRHHLRATPLSKCYSVSWAGGSHIIEAWQNGMVLARRIENGLANIYAKVGAHPGAALAAAGLSIEENAPPILLVSGGLANAVSLWRPPAGSSLGRADKVAEMTDGHVGYISALSFVRSSDGSGSGSDVALLSGSGDGTTMLWDVQRSQCKLVLLGHTADVTGVRVATASGGRLACTSSADGTARVWDLRSGACVRLFEAPTCRRAMEDVDVTADGSAVVVALATGGARGGESMADSKARWAAYDVGAYKRLALGKPQVETTSCEAVCFSHGGRCVLSGSESGSLVLCHLALADAPARCFDDNFDGASEKEARARGWLGGRPRYSAHQTRICSLTAAPDDSGRVASASFDGFVKVWRTDGFHPSSGSCGPSPIRHHQPSHKMRGLAKMLFGSSTTPSNAY